MADPKDTPSIEVISSIETPEEIAARDQARKVYLARRELMDKLIEDDVLPFWLVMVMIEMGIITLDEDGPMPCDDHHRDTHWVDYDRKLERYRELKLNPAPKPDGAEWGVTYTDHEAWEKNRKAWEEHRNVLPSACHVGCPIVAMAHGYQQKTAVPCVRGRQSQAHAYGWRDDAEKLALLSDPQDPVNVQGLRPCVMLGKMLRAEVAYPQQRRERERTQQEEQRWFGKKPEA